MHNSSANHNVSASTQSTGPLVDYHDGTNRKRVLSISPSIEPERRPTKKRPRVSSITVQTNIQLRTETRLMPSTLDRLPRSFRDQEEDDACSIDVPHTRARSLSRSSSYADFASSDFASSYVASSSRVESAARAQSVARALTSVRLGSECPEHSITTAMVDGMAFLRRSVSVQSFQSPPPSPTYPETSAKHCLRNTKVTIDFSLPSGSPVGMLPMSWSAQNIVVFARGDRIHYKNLSSNASDDIGQLCRIEDKRGDIRTIECAGIDQPNLVALGTSTGCVQIWDISSRKVLSNWGTKGVSAMKWNGPVLTIGHEKGSFRHFDTRIKETGKMKEQARRTTRHQSRISSLAWNCEGKLLATGDESGIVYCWDSRQSVPLDVGEIVQRRRKMQHTGIITALAWCPWKPKLFASGDSAADGTGTVCLWEADPSSSYQTNPVPEKLQPSAQVTSLHFSPHCKELLSTHGPGPCPDAAEDRNTTPTPETSQNLSANTGLAAKGMANSIAVHTVPSLRHVLTIAAASSKGLGGSVLNVGATKVILVVPEEGKLKVWDVWKKCKEGRRHSSFKNTIR